MYNTNNLGKLHNLLFLAFVILMCLGFLLLPVWLKPVAIYVDCVK